ncbi:MAG: DNA polymerase Y family protein [Planctomycetales bacterium]|nr:DNA polymerase Y family protein [Planctomycetales bacterium]
MRDARRGSIVAAANLAARAAGVRPRMRLSEATALVDTDIRDYDPDEDIDSLCNLAEQAQQFSPIVGLEQLDKKTWSGRTLLQPEALLLDVTGIETLFGGEVKLLQQVASWLAKWNYFGCLAIGSSVGAAWALANYATRSASSHLSEYSSVAENSAEALVPACRLVSGISEDEVLNSLPISALRLEATTASDLKRLGIQTIGQLSSLPRSGMATRLGKFLLTRWDQLIGKQAEAVVTMHAQPDWSLEQSLEYPTEDRATLNELVRHLIKELATRLSKRNEGALRVVCRMDVVDAAPTLLQLSLFRPSCDAEHLELLIIGQLEQQLQCQQPRTIWRLCLQATLTAPIVWRQTELFDGQAIENRQQIARLVDNLSNRLGRKQVLSAKIHRESQPELACTFYPMTGRRPDGSQQVTYRKLSSRIANQRADPSRQDPLRRPMQLFNPPIPIVMQLAASSALTPFSRFQYQGSWHRITQALGPERLESGWWRGPNARRDYYRVVTERGSWFWMYRNLKDNQWFLHGTFD